LIGSKHSRLYKTTIRKSIALAMIHGPDDYVESVAHSSQVSGSFDDGSTAYSLPRKPEGRPHTYSSGCLSLCFACVSYASQMRFMNRNAAHSQQNQLVNPRRYQERPIDFPPRRTHSTEYRRGDGYDDRSRCRGDWRAHINGATKNGQRLSRGERLFSTGTRSLGPVY